MISTINSQLDEFGFVICDRLIDLSRVDALVASLGTPSDETNVRRRGREVFAERNLLQRPAIREFAQSLEVRSVVEAHLGTTAKPVRGILFDKTPAANWVVPWHQDLSIAVKEKREVAGFGPWSVKGGVVHVQPPISVLMQMVTIRVHLDDCFESNGPLRVFPGSHRTILDGEGVRQASTSPDVQTCSVSAGGAVIMKPTLVHSSYPARSPSHRRVIHLEFANVELPGGLEWHVD